MADIAALRNGIQARLNTISGLRAYDVATGQETGAAMAIVLPRPPGGGWHQIGNGSCAEQHEFVVELHVLLGRGLRPAQDVMDGLINHTGAASVAAAISADPTLGGVAQTAIARAFTMYALSELNKVPTLMAMIPIEVTA